MRVTAGLRIQKGKWSCSTVHTKTKKFKNLQKEWYRILEDGGFEDIEIFNKKTMEPIHEFTGIKNNSFRQSKAKMDQHEYIEEYFIRARQYLSSHTFTCQIEKQIWELHSDGVSQRKIALEVGIRRDKVRKIIDKHKQDILPRPNPA